MRATTDPSLRSFIDVPPQSPFPIQNLPYGVFRPEPAAPPRVGVAIGEWVLDLSVLEERGFFGGPELAGKSVFRQPTLNAFAALGPAAWHEAREQISRLLRHDVTLLRDDLALRDQALVALDSVEMCLPLAIADYTTFAAAPDLATDQGAGSGSDAQRDKDLAHPSKSRSHSVGRESDGAGVPVSPAARRGLAHYAPVGRAERAGSIVVSGTAISRPLGLILSDAQSLACQPTRELDCELHLGFFIGRGNQLGRPIPISRAPNQIFGYVLVAAWWARDFQRCETDAGIVFASRNFATTISPWVVSPAALEPFCCVGPPESPDPPSYLRGKMPRHIDLHFEIALHAAEAEAPCVLSRPDSRNLYWSPVQLIAQHTINGCGLRPGDLIGVGPLDGPSRDAAASLCSLTRRGREPVRLSDGRVRTFLEDGDTVILTGWCEGGEYRIGFGDCRGTVAPAPLI